MPLPLVTGTNDAGKQVSVNAWNNVITEVNSHDTAFADLDTAFSAMDAALVALDAAIDGIDASTFGVPTRTALAAISTPADGQATQLTESGREGVFVFSTADLSAKVTADPLQGVYVAPTAAVTGGSGAWVRKLDGEINAGWFGVSGAASAATNTAALQAAVNLVLYLDANSGGRYALRLPVATADIQINDAIRCFSHSGGVYTAISQIAILGPNTKGYVSNRKCAIKQTDNTKPAFITQWGRAVRFEGFSIVGSANVLALPTYEQLLNDSVSPWYNTTGARDTACSPHAGIMMDPFSLTLPPDGGIPGHAAYYTSDNAGSTGLIIDDMEVQGFIVGIGLSLSYGTQLGDAITIKDCDLSYNKVAIAIGQSQNRGISIYDIHAKGFQMFVECVRYGVGNGSANNIVGGVLVFGKYLLNTYPGVGQGQVTNLYAESLWGLGFIGTTATAFPQMFTDCHIKFIDGQYTTGTEHHRADVHLHTASPVIFRGGYLGHYNNNPNALSFYNQGSITFEAVMFDTPPVLMFPNLTRFIECKHRYLGGTHGTSDQYIDNMTLLNYSDVPIPSGARIIDPANNAVWRSSSAMNEAILVDGTPVTLTRQANKSMTFTSAAPTNYQVGDTVYSDTAWTSTYPQGGATNTYTGLAIGRVLTIVGSLITLTDVPISIASGNTHSVYVFRMPYARRRTIGTTTSGSNSITSVSPAQGWAVGDTIHGANLPDNCRIITIAGTTYTISSNANATGVSDLYSANLQLDDAPRTAAPASGVWRKGDRVRNSAPAVGQPIGWTCTVSGEPGTWVSEGNL